MSIHRVETYRSPAANLPAFAIAYQPIVNLPSRRVVAYEALVRGPGGISYPQLIAGMNARTLRSFHRHTAEEAIRCAVALGLAKRKASLTVNLQPDLDPDAVNAEFLRAAAIRHGLPIDRIVVELTEDHKLTLLQVHEILNRNKAAGFASAMDDFGAGYSGLTSLVECRPEILKLDRALVSAIDRHQIKQKIVGAFVRVCNSLQMMLIAEGVETIEECRILRRLGVKIMQGYLFSRPVIAELPRFDQCKPMRALRNFGRRKSQADSGLHVITWNSSGVIIPQAKTA